MPDPTEHVMAWALAFATFCAGMSLGETSGAARERVLAAHYEAILAERNRTNVIVWQIATEQCLALQFAEPRLRATYFPDWGGWGLVCDSDTTSREIQETTWPPIVGAAVAD